MNLTMILLQNGTSAPVAPFMKGQGGNAPVMHPFSGVPDSVDDFSHQARNQLGAPGRAKSFSRGSQVF